MRLLIDVLIGLVLVALGDAALWAQDWGQPAIDSSLAGSLTPKSLDNCQVVANIDGQVVLACDVMWQVNMMIEENRERIPPAQLDEVREQLMKRHVASLVDTKLLYAEFRRNVPPENMPVIEENLRDLFQERDVPRLMKQFKVDDERQLQRELVRLGSSLDDARRAFNEKVLAGEWLRSNVKVNEEINPADLLEYYHDHEADYDYPAQARWEELMVRKSRFKHPGEAYAELAEMGNKVWQKVAANADARGPAFADVAKAKSDGFTADDGGVHDWTTKGALKAKVVDEALFSLEVGRMSRILEDDDSFYIVRVLERKEAGRKPFTDVQTDIRDQLKQDRFRQAVEKYLAEIRRNARIWTAYTGPVSADVLMGRKPDDETKQR